MDQGSRNLEKCGFSADERAAADYLYAMTIETRNFEISQLGSRNNFFMLFQGVMIAGLLQSSGGQPPAFLMLMAAGCGFALSILQTGMASGAKFWQAAWEHELNQTELRLEHLVKIADPNRTFFHLFARDPKTTETALRAKFKFEDRMAWILVRRFSVSKIPIYAGIFFSIFWFFVALFCIRGKYDWIHPYLYWP